MKLLIAGVLLFTLLHWLPVGAAGVRAKTVALTGENAWKGIFALLIAASIGLMIAGWKSAGELELYVAPAWGGGVAFICMLATSIMFFAPYMPNNLSRIIRHPQLAGIALSMQRACQPIISRRAGSWIIALVPFGRLAVCLRRLVPGGHNRGAFALPPPPVAPRGRPCLCRPAGERPPGPRHGSRRRWWESRPSLHGRPGAPRRSANRRCD